MGTNWTPSDVVVIITCLANSVVAIIGAWKGIAAAATSDANAMRIDGLANTVRNHAQAINTVSLATQPPANPQPRIVAAPPAVNPTPASKVNQ